MTASETTDTASITGLTDQQVEQRIKQGRQNVVTAKAGRSEKQIVLDHIFTYFNLVFVVLALILLFSGSTVTNMTFMIVVLINTAIGIFQQIRAKRAVDKLTLVAAQQVRTLRNGSWCKVRSDLLVQDDVVEFFAGDQICADAIVLDGTAQLNEALLTGETDSVEKTPGAQLLSGSFVASGRVRARLTQVGDDSFVSRLAKEAKADPRAAKSEMMAALDKLVWVAGVALIPVGVSLFVQEFMMVASVRESAEATVAALVGMIPEGLYLLTSVAMAASALKLTRDRVLVQDMNCIESLARVDVLCVDKTGTITEPEMTVQQVITLEDTSREELEQVVTQLYGCREPDNDTARAIRRHYSGESTWECEKYIPFDSAYKWCAGRFTGKGSFLAGAPERIMGQQYDRIREEVEKNSREGYRVLLVAGYTGDLAPGQPDPLKLVPLGLILLANRIRENAPETFRYFVRQGVTVKVISGDNPLTVAQVAKQAGIEGAEHYVDASLLETPEQIYAAAAKYTVFGRVTPDVKKQLILALKKQGHTVAMTGDGVNDVLAMKQADCAIAMASGAQAASQVARMVLVDSDFGAMPAIVAEGRRVINNIQRAATLFLVKNILSLGVALICLVAPWGFPFEPRHLTLIAALTIGVPGFFLAMEPNYARVEGKFLPTVIRNALPGGLTNVLVVVLTQLFMEQFAFPATDIATVCTAVLAVVGLLVLFKVSMPFGWFRAVVWGAMAVCLVGSFLLPPVTAYFGLAITDLRSLLVMAAAGLTAITVFVVMQWLFSLLDRLKIRKTPKK